MTYKEICDFIENKMRMSHIYQPLLIKTLVESEGISTTRKIALEFLRYDESQIQYYERVVKSMPVKVLLNHDVITKEKNQVSLNTETLSFSQRQKLISLCDSKLNEFLESRGLKLWDYRLIDNPVPDSLRYKVLKKSNFRCDLCGATKYDRPLDVDHIIPRSRKGKTEESNLQVLCSKCNRSKRNKDDTDFRDTEFVDKDKNCPFCKKIDKVAENNSVFAMKDNYPVSEGHLLIIPYRHTENFFSMTEVERSNAMELIRVLKNQLEESDSSITGFNIGMNSGESAGQTVMHSHIHLIPRRDGDIRNPRGGVRGVIPGKMDY
jgi:diadenosine tetraphosphate (Ap4A) HIT family hydrolase